MAVGETARLIASLELGKNTLTPGIDRAVGGLGKLEGRLGRIGGLANQGFRNAAANIAAIGAVAVAAIGTQVITGLKSIASIEQVQAQTAAALQSTGAAAGETLDGIIKRSQAWSLAIGANEEDVQHLQNILLTFTGITKDTFADATTAALDMSQALGQDFQSSAIQLGKALNDPIRGVTALRRVGVAFTKDQEKQIAVLVKSGKTLDAQRLILAELNKEFGGSAQAFGQTTTGKIERFKQAVQAAQRALATGFLPLLDRVVSKVGTLLADPKVIARIEKFGEKLAGGLDQILSIGGKLPWDAIGHAAELLGKGSKALLDAFTNLPPWVQTAVLTGWGLNKLTGGALGGIVGELGKGLIKGVLGMNAGVVNINAGVVNGGGGIPGAAASGAGGAFRGALATGARVVIPLAAGALIAQAVNDAADRDPSLQRNIANRVAANGTTLLPGGRGGALGPNVKVTNVVKTLSGGLSPDERQAANDQRRAIDRVYDSSERARLAIAVKLGAAAQATHYAAQQTAAAIRDINTTPVVNVNVNATTQVSIRDTAIKVKTFSRYGNVAS